MNLSHLAPLFMALVGLAVLSFGYLNWRYDLTRRYGKWLSGGRLKGSTGQNPLLLSRVYVSFPCRLRTCGPLRCMELGR